MASVATDQSRRPSRTEPQTAPIFVVGSPRSGTTLLSAMLDAHPNMSVGPETRFLGALEAADQQALLDSRRWPDPATDFVCGLHLRDASVHELHGRDRQQIRASMAARPPSIQAMLESLTAEHATANRKPRWVEKTPGHLLHVGTIRRLWPTARIVRMVRDPRDVALSQAETPFQSRSVVVNLCQISRFDRASRAFFARDPGSITLRFEDLVVEPQEQLLRLCEFLGETFEPAMIERRSGDHAFIAGHEWWKARSLEPLDPGRAGRWTTELDPTVARFAAMHVRDLLRAHGYPGAVDPARSVAVVPLGDRISRNGEALLLALAERGTDVAAMGPTRASGLRGFDDLVFTGRVGQLGVTLPRGRLVRWMALARLAALLGMRRIRGRPALWVRHRTSAAERPGHRDERDVAQLLKVFARVVNTGGLANALGVPHQARQTSADVRPSDSPAPHVPRGSHPE